MFDARTRRAAVDPPLVHLIIGSIIRTISGVGRVVDPRAGNLARACRVQIPVASATRSKN